METLQEPTEKTVDILLILEDLLKKTHILSKYHADVLNTVNDLALKLDVMSEVVELVSLHLEVAPEDFMKIVNTAIAKVKQEWQELAKQQTESAEHPTDPPV